MEAMFDFAVLRELRKRHGFTINAVSAKSGVSPAVISKLERNQTRAELETLFRISRVFSMNAADLIALAEARTGHRKDQDSYRSNGFAFRRIRYANLRCMYGTGKRGEHLSRPEIHLDDYELCWVLEGEVHVSLPGETHELKAGQSLQFDAVLEHTYAVVQDCRLMILHIAKRTKY
jgi:transcriptional regulator with XRE-family HTH domain